MRNSVSNIKKKITSILRRHNVKRAAVFGSFARGENKKGSDVDILIEFEKDVRKSLFDLARLKLDLEEILGKKVDVVEYSTIHPLLKDRILEEQALVL